MYCTTVNKNKRVYPARTRTDRPTNRPIDEDEDEDEDKDEDCGRSHRHTPHTFAQFYQLLEHRDLKVMGHCVLISIVVPLLLDEPHTVPEPLDQYTVARGLFHTLQKYRRVYDDAESGRTR